MENDRNPDPYEVVIADLRSQKERIETTISLLESLRAGGGPVQIPHASGIAPQPKKKRPDIGPGAFLGMSIPDAAKEVLSSHHRQMQTAEIVTELERGGIVMRAGNKLNNVGSILLRRFYDVGDIVRVSRGVWGLQEWYPGRKFPGARAKVDDAGKGDTDAEEHSANGNEQETNQAGPTAGAADWVDRLIGSVEKENGQA